MTTKLETVFKKAAALPHDLQDQLANQWLAELEEEQRWDETFAKTADTIDKLAERAIHEHQQGKTIPKGIDEL